MKNKILFLFISIQFIFVHFTYSQLNNSNKNFKATSALFVKQDPLSIQLKFSIKNIKKNTNDSTYVSSTLLYENEEGLNDSLKIKIKARGNHRRETCYYTPIKIKLKKSSIKGTLFEGNQKLKVVLPCLPGKNNNDLVLKEFLAYKLFEIVSPFHFKTRLVNIEFIEEKGQRLIKQDLKGILIEDIDMVANRYGGREYKKSVHPLGHDAVSAIQNNLFQFLIGNTDFSTRTQHNQKLLFVDKKFISIPYDFDMSGLVNANYAAVSGTENLSIKIADVTQRAYKGYKRDEVLIQKVRRDFINHKIELLNTIDDLKELFSEPKRYEKTKRYLFDFFEILESDEKFNKNIISRTRAK